MSTESSPALETNLPATHFTMPTLTGFAVVVWTRHKGFKAITHPMQVMGQVFSKIWIFGTPQTSDHAEVMKAVAPVMSLMPPTNIHRIS